MIRITTDIPKHLISTIVTNNIDKNLPKELKIHKLPIERKELMVKLINLRFNKLLELI